MSNITIQRYLYHTVHSIREDPLAALYAQTIPTPRHLTKKEDTVIPPLTTPTMHEDVHVDEDVYADRFMTALTAAARDYRAAARTVRLRATKLDAEACGYLARGEDTEAGDLFDASIDLFRKARRYEEAADAAHDLCEFILHG